LLWLADFGLKLVHQQSWPLPTIVKSLRKDFPDVDFYSPSPKASMKPDGGILSVEHETGRLMPILISEAKNQGTNDLRLLEGKKKQAMGNAIERLGKNVIGVRTAMLSEGITPFVCFGYGIDFDDGSSILDRVATIAMFGELNKTTVVDLDDGARFDRGSFYFRRREWTVAEMTAVLVDIASRSIHYYFAKYGESSLLLDPEL
jgi:type II restriction enzyme